MFYFEDMGKVTLRKRARLSATICEVSLSLSLRKRQFKWTESDKVTEDVFDNCMDGTRGETIPGIP